MFVDGQLQQSYAYVCNAEAVKHAYLSIIKKRPAKHSGTTSHSTGNSSQVAAAEPSRPARHHTCGGGGTGIVLGEFHSGDGGDHHDLPPKDRLLFQISLWPREAPPAAHGSGSSSLSLAPPPSSAAATSHTLVDDSTSSAA
jgi:hypothetical protein